MTDTRTTDDSMTLEEARALCACDFMSIATHRRFEAETIARHEALTTFEDRGIAGVLELAEELDEGFSDNVELRWPDLEQFVAQHNWRDPMAVYRLTTYLHEYHQAWHVRGKLTSALDGIGALVAHARD